MADPKSTEECIERHKRYSIDISTRLKGMQRERLKAMVSVVRRGWKVLDVGCNSGYISEFLPPRCEAHGVDVSAELVTKAKRRLVTAQVASAESLPQEDKSMDVVILGEILEHVFDPMVCLREAIRVARRFVVGSTPHEAGKWGPRGTKKPETHSFHVRCFTEATLRETLEKAGLTDVRIRPVARDGVPQVYVFSGQVPEWIQVEKHAAVDPSTDAVEPVQQGTRGYQEFISESLREVETAFGAPPEAQAEQPVVVDQPAEQVAEIEVPTDQLEENEDE